MDYNDQPMSDYDENLDWDAVGNPPGKGDYNVIIEKAEWGLSKAGKHMVKTLLKIEGYDPKTPENEKYIGRTVFMNLNFSQSGAVWAKQLMDILGIEKPTLLNKAYLEDTFIPQILSAQIGVSLDHRTFNDQLQANVRKFIPLIDVSSDFAEATEDNAGMDDGTGESEAEAEAGAEEEESQEQEEPPPPQPERRSLRAAQAAGATQIKIGNTQTKTNGHTNGHANGHTNGAKASRAKPAAKAPPPAKKGAQKTAARR